MAPGDGRRWTWRPGKFAPFCVLRATRERTDMTGRWVWTLWREANARAWVFEEKDGWTVNVDGKGGRAALGPYESERAARDAAERMDR